MKYLPIKEGEVVVAWWRRETKKRGWIVTVLLLCLQTQ
jgi:hypothetical protein